jgi:hypothetical protein
VVAIEVGDGRSSDEARSVRTRMSGRRDVHALADSCRIQAWSVGAMR